MARGIFARMAAKKELTVRQQRFVEEYLIHRSAAEAYRVAYDATRMRPSSVYTNGHRMLNHAKLRPIIEERLAQLGEDLSEETGLTVGRVMGMFADLALADPNELAGLRVGACRHCHGLDHLYQWKHEREYQEAVAKAEKDGAEYPDMSGGFGYVHTEPPAPDCPECGGEGLSRLIPQDTRKLSPGAKLLFQGVKHTKDGPTIIFADKLKALESVAKILGAFTEKLEVSGKVASVDVSGMSPQDAAAAYAALIKGG